MDVLEMVGYVDAEEVMGVGYCVVGGGCREV